MADNAHSRGNSGATVHLSRKDLHAALRVLKLLACVERGTAIDTQLHPPVDQATDTSRQALLARAREEFGNRRRRTASFGNAMFGEAAWDMLLALYILDFTGQRQTIGSLLQFSGTASTTAKRWLEYLEGHELVIRQEHPTDRRTAFVRLSATAREKLDMYYSETSAGGI